MIAWPRRLDEAETSCCKASAKEIRECYRLAEECRRLAQAALTSPLCFASDVSRATKGTADPDLVFRTTPQRKNPTSRMSCDLAQQLRNKLPWFARAYVRRLKLQTPLPACALDEFSANVVSPR